MFGGGLIVVVGWMGSGEGGGYFIIGVTFGKRRRRGMR